MGTHRRPGTQEFVSMVRNICFTKLFSLERWPHTDTGAWYACASKPKSQRMMSLKKKKKITVVGSHLRGREKPASRSKCRLVTGLV